MTEIIEGNKLIAEFMGCYGDIHWVGDEEVYRHGFKDTHITERWHESKFIDITPYHSSWDWLMPVVEKIEKMGYGFHKDPFDLNIVEYLSGDEEQIIAYQNDIDHSLIEKWYYVVVEFIKWYQNVS